MSFKSVLSILFFLCLLSLLSAQIDLVGNDKMYIKISNNNLKIPIFSNFSIDLTRSDIAHAVIVLHGTERNAGEYYNNMTIAAFKKPAFSDSTIIVSPQFLTEEDIVFHRLDKEHLYWTDGGWVSGSNSRNEPTNPRPARIPSYAVLDTLMMRLVSSFPNLKTIVFAGHSAGGQVVNRYSATSPISDILCQNFGISTKYIVANPSSYVYMDNRRAINGKVDQFGVPMSDCSGYNDWKFGLNNQFTYPAIVGQDSIRRMLKKRQVNYLVGQLDNDPNSSSLDVSCEAMLQGKHRLERGTIYFNYLKYYFGNEINKTQTLDTIPNAGHDNFKMFISDKALYHLFESLPFSCKQSLSTISQDENNSHFEVFPNPAMSHLMIRLPSAEGGIQIYNLQGIKLTELKNIENTEVKVDISSLNPGLYIVEYQHRTKSIKKRFLKIN